LADREIAGASEFAAALDLARTVVGFALESGADAAEATYTVGDRFSTEARAAQIEKLEQSIARNVTLRVFRGGAKASLVTSDLSPDSLRDFARETVDAARFVAADPYAGLPESAGDAPPADELGLYADDVRARPAEDKLADALALERVARQVDSRIVNSSGSRVSDETVALALVNSHGFAGAYRTSQANIGTGPIAEAGGAKYAASYGSASRAYAGLESVERVALTAAKRAVGMIGARKPPTMRCPVIFERDVASAVLTDLFAAVSAANVATGNSFLAGKVGERIGSALATIVDDGRRPGGLGSSPFDAEGVATRRTVVFERGVLRTFLYDSYYGRRLGAASTGNAAGGAIGPNNFYLEPGADSLQALIAATPRGVLVLDTIGFSTESVTGTYSRGARGYLIEGGEVAHALEEFTIAGNLPEMLAGIDRVASDLVFDQPIVGPSFRVAEMTVSGT
jgi:PmbA protein